MTISPNPYRGFRFPSAVIEHAVWLYHCFSLSLRDVELILAARGIVVSYESIREWGLRFGRIFANMLKRRRRHCQVANERMSMAGEQQLEVYIVGATPATSCHVRNAASRAARCWLALR